MRVPCRSALQIVLFLCWAAPAAAQLYNFHTYHELDGLPSSKVLALVQADEGALWIATARGLTRYDGVEWQPESHFGSGPTTYHPWVGRDADGRIWSVGYDHGTYVMKRRADGWQVHACAPDLRRSGEFASFGLARLADGRTVLLAATRQGEILVCDGSADRTVRTAEPGTEIVSIAVAQDQVLLATDRGLLRFDPDAGTFAETACGLPLYAVCPAKTGGFWLVGEDWIGRGGPDRYDVLAAGLDLRLDVPSSGVTAAEGPSGGLYFGDIGQVYYFHPDYGLELIGRANGLVSVGATDVMVDAEGHVWIAGLRGISKLVDRSLAAYDTRHGLLDNEVSALEFLPDGRKVCGHIGGLTVMGDGVRTYRFGGGNTILERVTDLARGPDGRVWFAADKAGIGWLDADGRLQFEGGAPGRPGNAYALHFAPDGTQWVGVHDQVLRRTPDGALEPVDLGPYGGGQLVVRRLQEGPQGSVLASTSRLGLLRIDGDGAHRFATRTGAPIPCYNTFATDDGTILVAAVAGLFEVVGDSLLPAGPDWPQVRRPVYALTRDTAGRLWIGTDNGVLRWDGQHLDQLTVGEGLLGADVNRDALKVDPRGDVWIGTDQGLNVFRSAFELADKVPPEAAIVGFRIDGEDHPGDAELRLPRPPRQFEVLFRGTAFHDERRTAYLAWLENFEEDWQPPRPLTGGAVRYTNLGPGTYRFHVRIRGANGLVGPVATSAPIHVMPQLMDRWWVRAAAALLGLVLVWGAASTLNARRYAIRLRRQVRDRTARLRLSETQLREESQRLAATLGSISDGVVAVDGNGTVLLCNAAAESILGREADDLRGRPWSGVAAFSPPLDLRPGVVQTRDFVPAAGDPVALEFSVAPLTDALGAGQGWVLAFRDVTSRRELENQRLRSQQLESLGVLAGGIAHDFNNLLTIILGNISLVEESPAIGGEESDRLERMKAATEAARALTEQFLTFARGGDPLLAPASLAEVVEQAATLAFSGATASYRLELPPDLWTVVIDRAQIGQVLNNLFLNAWQAMDGGGQVLISAHNCGECEDYPGGTGCVRLDVRDEGAGIPADHLERVFDPYFTTKESGTGLGLAIAHSIVRRHGGKLTVSSQPGHGSVFTLALPATDKPLAAPPAAARRDALLGGSILVLDDEAEVRDVCRGLLESLGMRYTGAADGEEALAACRAARERGEPFDAVIMDLTVPGGMGGKTAVRHLLAEDPGARVIVSSGYSRDPVLANFSGYGFAAVLRKPFDREALRRVLAAVLGDPAEGG